MNKLFGVGLLLFIAGGVGYKIGVQGFSVLDLVEKANALTMSKSSGKLAVNARNKMKSGQIIYYRDPDGKPIYSATSKNTDEGDAFVAIYSTEDVSFDIVKGPSEENTGERRILYYRNPMGLPDTSATPKKDSMGMDYIPVYEGDNDDGSIVKVSNGKLQRTGVKTTLASKSVIVQPVIVPGMIMLDERKISVVSTRTDIFVEQVFDVTTGTTISKGQPLFSFFGKEITAASAQYAADIKNSGGKKWANGSIQRLINLGVPQATINKIVETGEAPISVTLTAPRSGIVMERMAVEGMMAHAGETLFKIADTSSIWVIADVPEYLLNLIKIDAVAQVVIRSLPGHKFKGKVDLIYPQIQEQTRTARVRIEVANLDGVLLPNMFADVDISTGNPDPVVAVPVNALIDSGDRQIVIVDKGDGAFEPKSVKVGLRGGDMIEIVEGIEEGDRIVVSANFLIDAESNLKAALSALIPAEASE